MINVYIKKKERFKIASIYTSSNQKKNKLTPKSKEENNKNRAEMNKRKPRIISRTDQQKYRRFLKRPKKDKP